MDISSGALMPMLWRGAEMALKLMKLPMPALAATLPRPTTADVWPPCECAPISEATLFSVSTLNADPNRFPPPPASDSDVA